MSKTLKKPQPKSEGQKQYIRSIQENKITICTGPAGTGKTLLASRYAACYLFEQAVERIIIMRPMVQAGENTGFLPGDINEKMDPYIRPIYEELKPYFTKEQLHIYITERIIEVVPFAYARGRSFHNAFIIADELQNATLDQLILMLTRFGKGSKLVLTGDLDQSDLDHRERGGLLHVQNSIEKVKDVGVVKLTHEDIQREPIIFDILYALEQNRR